MNVEAAVAEIRRLKRGWTHNGRETRIIEILASCQGAELDEVLRALDVKKLLRDLSYRRLGRNNERRLLQLLVEQRLPDLSLETRANLVWAMQRGHTHVEFERAILTIILASKGEELRDLRILLNTSGGRHDLSKLVYEDIDEGPIRDRLLQHIRDNAVSTDQVKVLSDIDDTVFARLHDHRFPGTTRYPGVLAFLNALDRGPRGDGKSGGITFVTARPTLIAGLVERWTQRTLRKAGIERKAIITGSLLGLRSHRSMARRKVRSISRYRELFPEYGLVFVGDSGQGDVQVGRLLLDEFGDAIRGVFVHDVKATPLGERDIHEMNGIDFFDTYIAAAGAATTRGVISAEQALEVAREALSEIEAMKFLPAPVRNDRLREHRRDLAALRQLIAGQDSASSA